LFALPSVRAILPGAPDFGAISAFWVLLDICLTNPVLYSSSSILSFRSRYVTLIPASAAASADPLYVADLIGIIPNILIISLCTSIFAVSKLMKNRSSKEEKRD
jgi:hypothetical protein